MTACLNSDAADRSSPAETLIASPRPLVIAHRGYSGFAPENTILAFDRALAAGADLVELDYHHSAEGVPVVIHDSTLDRTTDAVARWGGKDLPVAGRRMEDLSALEAGAWFQPPQSGLKIPSLAQALDFIQSRGVTLIERKAGEAPTLSRLLRERGLVNRVVVQAFDWEFLRAFHRLEPEQVLGALGPPGSRDGRRLTDEERMLGETWLEEVRGLGARLVVWNRQVNAEAVRRAHALGLRVWIYTINDPALADDLLAMGVDGLITDHPALAWRVLAIRGFSSGAARR